MGDIPISHKLKVKVLNSFNTVHLYMNAVETMVLKEKQYEKAQVC